MIALRGIFFLYPAILDLRNELDIETDLRYWGATQNGNERKTGGNDTAINGKAIAYGGKQRNMRQEIGNKDTELLKMTYP